MALNKAGELKILHSWQGEALLFVIEITLAYVFISLALNSAKTLEYAAGIFFLVLAIRNLAGLIKRLFNR